MVALVRSFVFFVGVAIPLVVPLSSGAMGPREKQELRAKASEMFHHAYRNYMDHAYPADELMPLSCRGRYRGTHPSRGDIDDALGNFSLTLIDTLDTLVVLGEIDEFERAVRRVIDDVSFDSDIVVSVFETNIRVVGGLLGGHLMADFLKQKKKRMLWYNNELLKMAKDIGDRLLPAFNTSTGMPYPRVNLRYGVKHENSRTGSEKDTCTACAGTMLLEFSALSRLTGIKIYEEKATRAMDYLWESRHRASDLVGTVINIHNGDWVRRESGIGAGIDSYYEYLLKGYIMLGKDIYLDRFNKHYKAVMKYMSHGPLMLDVHMHQPQMNSRNFMDALLAFWPGLQVLKGDLKSAIEIHEMLYQVTLRHNFLPEAFTTDFRVHWAQHPLRPEFLESTYFIYKATGDPYYLEVGKSVIENLDNHARVPCGFAAIKDVTTGSHVDQMDSYVLAETFKYLYLLFSEKEDLILNVDDYIFTTEAHLLPLFLSLPNPEQNFTEDSYDSAEDLRDNAGDEEYDFLNTCPSTSHLFKGKLDFAQHLRSPLKNMVENLCPKPKASESQRLRASEFSAGSQDQVALLNRMGIRVITMSDGRVQLLHMANEAASPKDSSDGLLFMQEMVELSKGQTNDAPLEPRVVQLMTPPFFGSVILRAGPAQFGVSLKDHPGIDGPLAVAAPLNGCQPLSNLGEVAGKLVMVERGDCMFVDKARHLQNAGAIGGIIFDNNSQSSADSSPHFSMSGDGKSDVIIPLVFLFRAEAKAVQEAFTDHPNLVVYVSEQHKRPEDVLIQYLSYQSRSLTLESRASRGDSGDDSRSRQPSVEPSSSPSSADSKAESDLGAGIRDLIALLLRKISMEHLEPFVKTRSREKLDSRVGGSFPVRVIRMPDGSSGAKVQMETGTDEEAQHMVRVVFTEFLMLLLECTNLKQLGNLNQVVDAFARLTENVFTGGRMGFGVHTETVINEIKGRLVATGACSPTTPLPAVPDVAASPEGGPADVLAGENGCSVSHDGVLVKATVADSDLEVADNDLEVADNDLEVAGNDLEVADNDLEVAESRELERAVGEFIEDQLEGFVKELVGTSMQESLTSSPVEVIVVSESEALEPSCGSSQGSLLLDGYRRVNGAHVGKIEHQVNFAAKGESETADGDVVSNDDVITTCGSDTVVDDVSKLTISDTTDEPAWQDSRDVADQIDLDENVAPNENVVIEAGGIQSDPPKRTSGGGGGGGNGGILDGNSGKGWNIVVDEEQDQEENDVKSRSSEEIVIEYADTQMQALEQRLRSSDDQDLIDFDLDLTAEDGEDVEFWETKLGKDRAETDNILDTNFKNGEAHIEETSRQKSNVLLPRSSGDDDDTGSLNSEIQTGDRESSVQNTFATEDTNAPDSVPPKSPADYAH